MRRLSSRWTFFYKWIFPAIWFGGLLIFLCVSLFQFPQSNPAGLPFLIFPIIMIGFGFFLMKKLVFDLVDEVWDDGDTLLIRSRGQEERVNLADIKNVSCSPLSSPPRVTLSLRRPSIFGDQVTFCGPVRLLPIGAYPVIDDLIDRVDAARERSK